MTTSALCSYHIVAMHLTFSPTSLSLFKSRAWVLFFYLWPPVSSTGLDTSQHNLLLRNELVNNKSKNKVKAMWIPLSLDVENLNFMPWVPSLTFPLYVL